MKKEALAKKDKSPVNKAEDRKRRESDCSPHDHSQTPGPDRGCRVQVITPEEKEQNKVKSASKGNIKIEKVTNNHGEVQNIT